MPENLQIKNMFRYFFIPVFLHFLEEIIPYIYFHFDLNPNKKNDVYNNF